MSLAHDIYSVALMDMYYLKRNFIPVMVSSITMPLLYFISFAYGLGDHVSDVGGVSYVAFVVPGIVALSTLSSSFSTTCSRIMVQRRFYASFDELMLCPVSTSSVIIGKTVLGMCKSIITCAVMLGLGCLVTDDMVIGPSLILMILLCSFVFSLLGVVGGLSVTNMASMNLFNSFVILPMTFLCGTVFSTSALPSFAQAIIYALPLTHASECIRACALGAPFPFVSLIVLMVYGAAFYLVSYHILRRGSVSI